MIQKRKLSKYTINSSFIECDFKMLKKLPNHLFSKVNIKTFYKAGPNANLLESPSIFSIFLIAEYKK